MKRWLILCGALALPPILAAQQPPDSTTSTQPAASSTPTSSSTPAASDAPLSASADSAKARIARALRTKGINPALAEYWRLHDQDSTATPERLLNDLGYDLLKQSRVDDAIRAFRANIAAYPESPRVYEAIGDAYLAGGHRTAARDGYRRAAELDSTMTRSRRLADSLNAHLRH
jgi:tetratricopeptide (TPR) repeat protein